MNILITTGHLADLAGSELYVCTLADELTEMGHKVTIYSPILGKVIETIKNINRIEIVNNLADIKRKRFDVIHMQHNITAWVVRKQFKSVPAIMTIHGIIPKLEQPPRLNLGIAKYVAVSDEVAKHLQSDFEIPRKDIKVINNWVDQDKFIKLSEIHEHPKKLLVVSNHMSQSNEKIYRKVCKAKGVEFEHVGLPENPVKDVEQYINSSDIVVTLGRGAMEAMACGRNVILSDVHGLDGMVTPKSYPELIKNNLSGRRYAKKLSVKNFTKELEKYSPSYSSQLIDLVNEHHNKEKNIKKIMEIYKDVKNTNPTISPHFNKAIEEIDFLVNKVKDDDYQIRMLKAGLDKTEIRNN